MKKNKVIYKDIFVLVMTSLFFIFLCVVCGANNMDQIWEYGFSHNVLQGMLPYKDFNMVVLPFHTYICAFLLKIFFDKYILYLFFHAMMLTVLSFFLYKKTDKSYQYFLCLFFLSLVCAATYNILLLCLFFALLFCEEEKKNDYAVGVILALAILTKQSVGICLLFPTFLLKDKKRIVKRFSSILGIGLLYTLYLIFTGSFYDCINYTFLGLLDFSNKNKVINLFFLFYLVYVVFLIIRYIKTKEKRNIYYICFSTLCIPLFDFHHFFLGIFPFVIECILNLKIKNKLLLRILSIYSLIILFYTLSLDLYNAREYIVEKDKTNLFYLTSEKYQSTYNKSDYILKFYKKYRSRQVYVIGDNSYFYSLDNNIPITRFSHILYGNNGYNGNENLRKKIDALSKNTIFIYDVSPTSKQHNKEIYDYIVKKSIKIDGGKYGVVVYQKK